MDDDEDLKPWNGYLYGVGFIFLVAGAAVLGVSFRSPLTVKIDRDCEDAESLRCPRHVPQSAKDDIFNHRLSGSICLALGIIITTIDCMTCFCKGLFKSRRSPNDDGRSRSNYNSGGWQFSLSNTTTDERAAARRRGETVPLTTATTTTTTPSPIRSTTTSPSAPPTIPTTTAATSLPSAPTIADGSSNSNRRFHRPARPVRRATPGGQQWQGMRFTVDLETTQDYIILLLIKCGYIYLRANLLPSLDKPS